MAVPGRTATLHFLVLFLMLSWTGSPISALQNFQGTCGLTIDLYMTPNIQSGVLKMPLPDSFDQYQDPTRPINCDIIITFTSGMNLLIELYFLDIMPKSNDLSTCTTGLEIFDQTGRSYYGGRLCMEGWQWEERHREKNNEKLVVMNSPLTLRLVSQGPYRGEGFKLHFNQFRPYWPCYIREFKCTQIQRCVHDDVTCDGWDDCGDYSDERIDAGCSLLTASEICALIMGILTLIGSVALVVMFFIARRRYSYLYGTKSESKAPIVDEKIGMEPVLSIGRRVNSQDSIPSRYSKSTAVRRDSDSDTIDKAELEGAERFKIGDNMSERSYRSNPRRTTAQSLASEPPVEPIKKSGQYSYGSRKGGSQSSLNFDKVDLNGKVTDKFSREKEKLGSSDRLSGRSRDRDSLDRKYRRGRDRYSDDEDDDDDRYDERKRRSSRERDRRRRSDRYSSEDDDDDSDYDRRRRSRRRSYDRYSDESDYEYEREKERRRRSRDRYSRDRYDDEQSETDRDQGPDRVERKGRDKYSDDDDDSESRRGRGRSSDRDRSKSRRDSRERDKDKYRNSYDEDERPSRRNRYDDDGVKHVRRRKSEDRVRNKSLDKDSKDIFKNGDRSRSQDEIETRGREFPIVMPPPYTEEDARRVEQLNQQNQTTKERETTRIQQPPPFSAPPQSDPMLTINQRRSPAEQQFIATNRKTEDRHKEPQRQQPPRTKTTDEHIRGTEERYRVTDERNRMTDERNIVTDERNRVTDDRNRVPDERNRVTDERNRVTTERNRVPDERNRVTDDRKKVIDDRKKELQAPVLQKAEIQPPKEVNETDRRRSTDSRRERYSRQRWTPKDKSENLAPPEYEDVAPASTFVGISYKEESV